MVHAVISLVYSNVQRSMPTTMQVRSLDVLRFRGRPNTHRANSIILEADSLRL